MKELIKSLLIIGITIMGWTLSITLFKMYKFPDWINVIYSLFAYLIWFGSASIIAFKRIK